MRESIKQFVKICVESMPLNEPIYEFGSLRVPGQEVFADLRPLFPNKKYIGADMRQGLGVDVVINLHNISLPSESVGTVLLMDTLEHVEFPRKAIEELHRILKPNGALILSSAMNFPIHDYPSDYWRFTPEAFRSLLKLFTSRFVGFAGEEVFPHTVVGIGVKDGDIDNKDEFLRLFKNWKKDWSYSHDWKGLVTPFVPPVLVRVKKALL